MADEIVLSFQDSLLRQSDLRLLEEGRWLNDRLIGFMFDYFTHHQFEKISQDVLFISPDVTQFLKLAEGSVDIGDFIEPLNIPSHKLVFFAVNDNESTNSVGGSHWSLLLYKRQTNSFHHYDSSTPFNTSAARSLAKNVEPFLLVKDTPSFIQDKCPQQQNGYDCGVYVITITEELCKNFLGNRDKALIDTMTVKDITQKRELLKNLILNLSQEKT
ncbi:unnamed protein product [Porites evermanni]|uniref:Ubiquitin-like protease family profile domain-containing protein n=1 Tax=Porites evermanni TaxID=104178 RepID=A0ABN8MCS6_9CNID|nr:unnamed protein product [Porites evermanni]